MGFHECITSGSLNELRKALINGADVNLPGRNGATPLMMAIAANDVQKMQLQVDSGADPELTDDFNSTALGHAVSWDFADCVQFLLDLGVDRGYSPKYPLKKVKYDFELTDLPLPDSFKAVMSEEDWKKSLNTQKDSMSEMGENSTCVGAIGCDEIG